MENKSLKMTSISGFQLQTVTHQNIWLKSFFYSKFTDQFNIVISAILFSVSSDTVCFILYSLYSLTFLSLYS